jgi:hypothetical protein
VRRFTSRLSLAFAVNKASTGQDLSGRVALPLDEIQPKDNIFSLAAAMAWFSLLAGYRRFCNRCGSRMIALAIRRLRALSKWRQWITFCAQGASASDGAFVVQKSAS